MIAHEKDRYQWALETAAAIRAGNLAAIDLESLAEEVELVARADAHELRSRLEQIVEHLLKLTLTTGQVRRYNEAGWTAFIERQRSEIRSLLESSPSLERLIPGFLPKAYRSASRVVRAGFELTPPAECPFSLEEILGTEND